MFKKKPPCDVKSNGKPCGINHDVLLHGSGNKYCLAAGAIALAFPVNQQQSEGGVGDKCCHGTDTPVLLEVQQLLVGPKEGERTPTTVFFDNGATVSLCTPDWAEQANLKGVPTTLYLQVVGQTYQKVDTRVYTIYLAYRTREVHSVAAYGMDMIRVA